MHEDEAVVAFSDPTDLLKLASTAASQLPGLRLTPLRASKEPKTNAAITEKMHDETHRSILVVVYKIHKSYYHNLYGIVAAVQEGRIAHITLGVKTIASLWSFSPA